jgi:hypothetical protein
MAALLHHWKLKQEMVIWKSVICTVFAVSATETEVDSELQRGREVFSYRDESGNLIN